MKKSVVTIAMALLLVSPGALVVTEELLTFVIAMPFFESLKVTQSDRDRFLLRCGWKPDQR